MRRALPLVALFAGCFPTRPLKTNEAVAKSDHGRHPGFHATVASATAHGQDPVVVTFGAPPQVVLTIPLCYPHAQSKVGDHDKMTVELVGASEQATAGELDIDDCVTTHLTGRLWATFPSGIRVEAKLDTPLSH